MKYINIFIIVAVAVIYIIGQVAEERRKKGKP